MTNMRATLCESAPLSRRAMLTGAGALFAWTHAPRIASAAGARDPRLVVIILRGALDGLTAVGPVGDPDYISLHGEIALSATGPDAARPLDSFFALNPGMPTLHRLFAAKQATIFHAVATPYRERSHFDGQDVLESGLPGVGRTTSGWLNRALAALPAGQPIRSRGGLGVGVATPLVLRGPAPVVGWAPQAMQPAGEDLGRRVIDLYRHTDPALAEALARGLDTDRLASREMGDEKGSRGGMNSVAGMAQAARGAARLLAAPDGPRVAALAFDGWDTHANEGGPRGRLAQLLSGLDGAFGEFEKGLGDKWRDTVIVTVTEFGRTARINGTTGTDHGTATVAFLAGGAVAGGRVIADWPGLKSHQLHENRDLRPTTDLRAMLKGVLGDHLGLGAATLAGSVFPESGTVKPVTGLLT
ncbi:MAG: DUF1501 domain-containing protein [Hyphomicrobiales bacterium]|nr:DUF1501 domain-containing protein [Hyphomicrobiales bacterium]MCC2108829.1 DUF1501 domain-containing protein [Hyphomicrobiales bacterium]